MKTGNYIGTLREPGIVVLAKGLKISDSDPRAIEAFGLSMPEEIELILCDQKISGPIRLIKAVCSDTFDKVIAAFGHELGDDLWMLAISRLFNHGCLIRAGRWFSTTENSFGLELMYRYGNACVMSVSGKEIDFLSYDVNWKYMYFQVSVSVTNPETLKRKLAQLKALNDNYPKFIITLVSIRTMMRMGRCDRFSD